MATSVSSRLAEAAAARWDQEEEEEEAAEARWDPAAAADGPQVPRVRPAGVLRDEAAEVVRQAAPDQPFRR